MVWSPQTLSPVSLFDSRWYAYVPVTEHITMHLMYFNEK